MSAEDSIEFLDLHPKIIDSLRVAKIKRISRVLELSLQDLCSATKLRASDASILVQCVSLRYLKKENPFLEAVRALEEEKRAGHLSMGCAVLDNWLQGGLLVSRVTEIAGVSSAGKTQICLQLALNAQLPKHCGGLDAQTAYICTEDAFPDRRLCQMAEIFARTHPELRQVSKDYTDRIFVSHSSTAAVLESIIDQKLPAMLTDRKVRLVIVDSVAALFRADYESDQMWQRSKVLLSLGAKLRRIAHHYNAVVVVVNQVTGAASHMGAESIRPSLGETWASQLNVRLMVNRTNADEDAQSFRDMSVVFAPHLPPSSVQYYIDDSGVHGVHVDEFLQSLFSE